MSYIDGHGEGLDWNSHDSKGGRPYVGPGNKSRSTTILVILFCLAIGLLMGALWEPNDPPPKMNQHNVVELR